MLYMATEIGVRTLKIGYTDRTMDERTLEYQTCSTVFRVVDTIPGTKDDERNYQLVLESLGFSKYYEDSKNEWYVIPNGISKKELTKKGFDYFNK